VKAVGPSLIHKSDVGAVRLDVAPADAGAAAAAVLAAARAAGAEPQGVLVQPMAEPGVELLVGVTSDPDFGPVVACAAGGVTAELIDDVQVRLAPLDHAGAVAMVRALRMFPLLDGYRGAPRSDVAALADIVVRLAALAAAHPQIAELDCNPVVVGTHGASSSTRACASRRRRRRGLGLRWTADYVAAVAAAPNSASSGVSCARGTMISGHSAARISRPVTPPSSTARAGP
jgi:acyl-CoA synthetase (NDP forming)